MQEPGKGSRAGISLILFDQNEKISSFKRLYPNRFLGRDAKLILDRGLDPLNEFTFRQSANLGRRDLTILK